MSTYRVAFTYLPNQTPKVKDVTAINATKATGKALKEIQRDLALPAGTKHLFKFHSCKKLVEPDQLNFAL